MTVMTRRQLYDLVWSKPMRMAAADLSVSDVGLKKVCVRHGVPVPPQGYWNKVHAGHTPPKVGFGHVDDPALDRISIAGSTNNAPPAVQKAVAAAKAVAGTRPEKIAVSAGPPTAPAAVDLLVCLSRAKPRNDGLVEALGPRLLHAKVAPESVGRAVAVVDALLKAAAERGFVTRPGEKRLGLVVDDELVELQLSESMRWVPRQQTPAEVAAEERQRKAAQAKYGGHYSWLYRPEARPGQHRPQGPLSLEIPDKEYNVRCRWRDTPARKLEALLNRVLVDLTVYAAMRKVRRAERERREREWQRAEQRRAKAEAQAERERARLKFLKGQLELFEETIRLERFLSQLAQQPQTPSSGLREFVHWTEQRLQELTRQCSAVGMQKALAESRLFGPRPK
jgi:hypothetical protein